MTSNIFIDSSVLIETYKGNKVKFYKSLFSDIDNQFFINDIVLSEYLYFILGFNSGVSPRTLQQKKEIASTINSETEQINILEEFQFLSGNQSFLLEIPRLMSDYNLLPNDAIILATCKLHGTKLASHDSDFIIPCKSENIELLRSSNS
ncbi:MAG TPA: type II toxin-antitoxin system VapC family toxin [Ginsengibacter sp.]